MNNESCLRYLCIDIHIHLVYLSTRVHHYYDKEKYVPVQVLLKEDAKREKKN